MLIRFLKSYRGYQEGRSYECPDGAALVLIQRKIAEETDAKSAKKQPKTKAAPSTETATA